MIETPQNAAERLQLALSNAREEAAVLRRVGNAGLAEYIDKVLDGIESATEDMRTWLPETKAIIKSGLAERTLRRRFRELFDCGLARYGKDRQREYLAIAIPPRPNTEEARARGKAIA